MTQAATSLHDEPDAGTAKGAAPSQRHVLWRRAWDRLNKKALLSLGVVGAVLLYIALASRMGSHAAGSSAPTPEPKEQPPVAKQPSVPAVPPKAVAPETVHDFGMLPPDVESEHVFLIHNRGEGPLELSHGGTTCKCALAELPTSPIPPNSTGRVKITWTTVTKGKSFEQKATVRTNDPERKKIQFTIKGTLGFRLGTDPGQVLFSSLHRGESQTRRVTLFSQLWNEFDIARITAPDTEFQWTIKPADPATLQRLEAKSGYDLEVNSPSDQPVGYFTEQWQVFARPAGPEQREERFQLTVAGNVLPYITVYGLEEQGLSLGTVVAGEGFKRRLLMQVRGHRGPLHVARIEAKPSFLKVSVEPMDSTPKANLYRVIVEVPANAAPCAYTGSEKGYVLLVTNHPQEREFRFPVRLVVVPGPATTVSPRSASRLGR